MRTAALFCIFLLSAFASGCIREQHTVPDKFHRAYADMRIVTAQFGQTDPQARLKRNEILQRYGITRKQFEDWSLVVRNNPELWQSFQQDVNTYLDSLNNADQKKDQEKVEKQ